MKEIFKKKVLLLIIFISLIDNVLSVGFRVSNPGQDLLENDKNKYLNVSVQSNIIQGSNVWETCSGTLIGPRTILTAAHCVMTTNNLPLPLGSIKIFFYKNITSESYKFFNDGVFPAIANEQQINNGTAAIVNSDQYESMFVQSYSFFPKSELYTDAVILKLPRTPEIVSKLITILHENDIFPNFSSIRNIALNYFSGWSMYNTKHLNAELIGSGYSDACKTIKCQMQTYKILASYKSEGTFHGFVTNSMKVLHGASNIQDTLLLKNAFIVSFMYTSSDPGDSGGALYIRDPIPQNDTIVGIVHSGFLYSNQNHQNYSRTPYLLNIFQGFSYDDIIFINNNR